MKVFSNWSLLQTGLKRLFGKTGYAGAYRSNVDAAVGRASGQVN